MRIFFTILGNFLIPTVFGGFIFGMVMAANITLYEGRPEDTLPAMGLMGVMSAIFAFFIFLSPGLAYSVLMGILSASIADRHIRRRVLVGIALLAGFTIFPLFIWLGDTGFKNAWWIIALISGPLFAISAYLMDKLLEESKKPNKAEMATPRKPSD